MTKLSCIKECLCKQTAQKALEACRYSEGKKAIQRHSMQEFAGISRKCAASQVVSFTEKSIKVVKEEIKREER